ncbi:MAG: response regulator [Bacteroidales bacterium]
MKNEGNNTLSGYSVLLVEDNKMNQILATAMLKNWGADVVIAANGKIAIETMEKENFDIILMDIQMPVMDGLTASKIIRENLKSTTPILALSANVLTGVAEKCNEYGIQAYIPKPYDAEELVKSIIYHVSRNRTRNDDSSEPTEPIIVADTSPLKGLLGSNLTELNNMIARFLELTPAYVRELNKAMDENNIEAIASASHKIKPSIDLVSSKLMRESIANIYNLSKAGHGLNDLKQSVSDFNMYYKLLETQLLKEIS